MSEVRESLEGGCQCGAVRYRIDGAPVGTVLCHCAMCRRANAAPVVAWAMYADAQVTFLGAPPTFYASSPEAVRGFCGVCGTQICFRTEVMPGLIDMTIGSLDDPAQVAPQLHMWTARQLPWMTFADGLPRHAEFPPMPSV